MRKKSIVIVNRLNTNMTLGIDASVRYGVKYFNKRLRKSHLKKKTCNTYLFKGLPKSPIYAL